MSKRPSLWLPAALLGVGAVVGSGYLAWRHRNDLRDWTVEQAFEKPSQALSYADLKNNLERSGVHLAQRAARAEDSRSNRELLTHIIAIERWGQNRLRVALGQKPFERDGSALYRPTPDASLRELRELLSQTRSQTVELVRQLQSVASAAKVEHNGLGELSPKGWLRYLTLHAALESRKLKNAKAL